MPDGLTLTGVRAGYGATTLLEGIDLALPARSSLAVLGRNGVGKTTLMKTLMGLTRLHAGRIEYRATDVAALPVHERARLGFGYVPQAREVFRSLTLDEHLAVAARRGPWSRERIFDLFPGLAQRRRHLGDQLSGGEQQMLAIARALVGNPSLLLLDEPLEGLAPVMLEALLKVLARLIEEESLTVILVEQHARIALELTTGTLVLDRGRAVYSGPSAALLADPARLTDLVVGDRPRGGAPGIPATGG